MITDPAAGLVSDKRIPFVAVIELTIDAGNVVCGWIDTQLSVVATPVVVRRAGATTTVRLETLSIRAAPPAASLSVRTNVAAIPVAVKFVT